MKNRLPAALPYAVFLLLVAVSWNRWIEPYVDSGRELMVPWRLLHGERLYRDVHFHHGPLGPFLAAAADGMAGRSLPARTTLYALVTLAHLAGLSRLSRRLLSPWRAGLATSIAVAAAVFLRPGGWLFPFSFDTSIAVAALTWALVLAASDRGYRNDAAGGACLLAALLARPELGLAAVALFALSALRKPRRLVPLALAPLSGATVGYGILSAGIGFDRLVVDGWLRMLDPPAAFRNVYGAYAGLDRIGLRAAELAIAAIVLGLAATLVASAAWIAARLSAAGLAVWGRTVAIFAVLILGGLALIRLRPPPSMADTLALFPPLVRVIPVGLLAAAAIRLVAFLRGRAASGLLGAAPDAVVWIGGLFSARLLLAAGYVGPYDAFFLPLPIVLAVAAMLSAADRAAPAAGPALPGLTVAALSTFLAFRVLAMGELYRARAWALVATPAGSLWLPEAVAGPTAAALTELERLPRDSTLAGFPETGFFNYALGYRNPFWLEQFFPGHLDRAGEARAIALLEARPPDVLLFANVLAVGEGAHAFGSDYLRGLDAAARSRYTVVAVFGQGATPAARIGDPEFFVEIARPATQRRAEPFR